MAAKKRAKVPRQLLRDANLTEIAILEMTNNAEVNAKGKKSQSVVLTTKESYLWAALLAHIAEKSSVAPEELVKAITTQVMTREDIKRAYSEFPSTYKTAGQATNVPDILQTMIKLLHLDLQAVQLEESARASYQSLLSKGLIEDPLEILIGGIAVAVLGVTPVSFTRKTKAGQQVSKKLKALYWEYEKSEKAGVVTTNFEFRLLKLVKAFHAGMVGGFKSALQ